jgi:hypothetical protein
VAAGPREKRKEEGREVGHRERKQAQEVGGGEGQAGLDAGGLGCFLFSFSSPFSISFLVSKLKSI